MLMQKTCQCQSWVNAGYCDAEAADISRLTNLVPWQVEEMGRTGTESGHSMELSSKTEPLPVMILGRARQKGSRAAHVRAPSCGTQVPTDPKLI
jgi:hypothetical protein